MIFLSDLQTIAFQGYLASHASVLRGSWRVPAPGTRDEPLRRSAGEAKGYPMF